MDRLWKLLLVFCVCNSAVEARHHGPTTEDEPPPEDKIQTDWDHCKNAMYGACLPIAAQLRPHKRSTIGDNFGAPILWHHGVRETCRIVSELHHCYQDTLSNECSDAVREEIQPNNGEPYVTMIDNALQYACVQHIEILEEVINCIKPHRDQSVGVLDVLETRCTDIVPHQFPPLDICSVPDYLECPKRVIAKYCGDEGAEILEGLILKSLSDYGCYDVPDDTRSIQSVVELLRRAFK
jgi:hypothetical protein